MFYFYSDGSRLRLQRKTICHSSGAARWQIKYNIFYFFLACAPIIRKKINMCSSRASIKLLPLHKSDLHLNKRKNVPSFIESFTVWPRFVKSSNDAKSCMGQIHCVQRDQIRCAQMNEWRKAATTATTKTIEPVCEVVVAKLNRNA